MKVELFMQVIDDEHAGKFDRKVAVKDNHHVKKFAGPDAQRKATKFYDDLRELVRSTGI